MSPDTKGHFPTLANRKEPNGNVLHAASDASRQPSSPPVRITNPKSYFSYQPGSLLFELAAKLSSRVWHERSFALRPGKVYANRFLLTVDVTEIAGDARKKILDACAQMRMPAAHVQMVSQHLAKTRYFALGFEQGAKANVYKAYLEQFTPSDTHSEHFGFKWDAAFPARNVVTRYIYYPGLSLTEIQSRVANAFAQLSHPTAVEIARDLIHLAAGRMPENLCFLEVDEPGNDRRSFDLNFYGAGLRISDIEAFLCRMWKYYGVQAATWQPMFEAARDDVFGHLSGGLHRTGEDFFTIYYGKRLILGRPRKPRPRAGTSPLPNSSAVAQSANIR